MNKAIHDAMKGVPQLAQRQDSTDDQLRDLMVVAARLGLYDAQDVIRLMLDRGLSAQRRQALGVGSVAERQRCIRAVPAQRVDDSDAGDAGQALRNQAMEHAADVLRRMPLTPESEVVSDERAKLISQLKNPWAGRMDGEGDSLEVRRLWGLCQSAARLLEGSSGE